MPEQDLNPAAAKFISSLVKSLQILCNGQVEFCESIELVGHINVRVDHKYKFDYIVDEHVSKEGEDSATTFLSNSYHSSPPSRQPKKKSSTTDFDHDIMFSEIPHNIHEKTRPPKDVHEPLVKSNDFCSDDTLVSGEENCPNFSVDVSSPKRQGNQVNQMVVKLEGDDDSNDCMVLPASPGDFEPVGEVTCEGFPSIGPSASFEESHVNQMGRTRKRRQPPEQYAESDNGNMICMPMRTFGNNTANHLSKEEDGSTGTNANILCQCLSCQRIFSSEQDFNEHSPFCEQPVKNYCCSQCFYRIDSHEGIEFHMQQCHPIPVQAISCTKCSAHFKTHTGLKMHMEVKHRTNPTLTCPICGKIMYNKTNLDGHINQHKGIKPHVCTYCHKTFSYKQSASAHEKLCPSKPY